MADDLGYADLGYYGRRDYETPNIDRIARDGLRLTQGYAYSPVCSPTRFALITGRYQYRLRGGLEEPILGLGGGADLLLALRHNARSVDVVEPDGGVADLLRGELAGFTGQVLSRPGVRLHVDAARRVRGGRGRG
jgi:hypothetical protein